jgi:hypothetical protein
MQKNKKQLLVWLGVIGSIASIVGLIVAFYSPQSDRIDNSKQFQGNKSPVIENAGSVSINYEKESNLDEIPSKVEQNVSMTCEPVLDSQVKIYPSTFSEFMMDESRTATLVFMVKFIVFNQTKRNNSVTEFRWIMGYLPNGTMLYQRLRGPFNRSQFRNGGIIELPLNLAQGEAAYVFADVLQYLEEEEAKLLYKKYEELGAKEGVVDFMLLHNYLMKSNIEFTGAAVTAYGEVIQCSKFWLEEVKQIHPVIEANEKKKDEDKINFEAVSYLTINESGGLMINSSPSSLKNMRSHFKMLSTKKGIVAIYTEQNTELSEATFTDLVNLAQYYNVPFTFSATSNFSDVKKEFNRAKKN